MYTIDIGTDASVIETSYDSVYKFATLKVQTRMSLDQAVDDALAAFDMPHSTEAEETGRMVATLQD